MKPGDCAELGAWCRGEHEHEEIKAQLTARLVVSAHMQGVRLDEPIFTRHEVGDPRLPTMPRDFQGLDVHFLSAEAKVIGFEQEVRASTFIGELSHKELMILREATRRAHMRQAGPQAEALTDQECDSIIEEVGPVVGERLIREAVNATKH